MNNLHKFHDMTVAWFSDSGERQPCPQALHSAASKCGKGWEERGPVQTICACTKLSTENTWRWQEMMLDCMAKA